MSWRDRLRETPLSFRGVRIVWDEETHTGGFTNDKRVYPSPAGWDIEQMSQVSESFSIKGKLLGEDYLDKKRALLAALRMEGAGELMLPGIGSVNVLVTKWNIKERVKARGMAEVTISFDRARPSERQAAPLSSDPEKLRNELRTATAAYAKDNLDVSSADLLLEARRSFGKVFQALTDTTALLQGKAGPAASVLWTIQQAESQLDTLLLMPTSLTASLFNCMTALTSFVATNQKLAMLNSARSGLESLYSAVTYHIDPGRNEFNTPIPKTRNTATAEHIHKVVSLYGAAQLVEDFVPLSASDAAEQSRSLVALSSSAEGESAAENEAITQKRVYSVGVLQAAVVSGKLAGEKTAVISKPRNLLALATDLGTPIAVLSVLNRPADAFAVRGAVRYV